jgi:PhnB protein
MPSQVKPVPEGYHTLTPHLIVQGAPKLLDFLKQAFDAKEKYSLTGPNGAIMHAEVKIGDSMVMIGEAMGEWKAMPASIALYTDNADALYKRALEAGATSIREPADQFYGDRSGGVKDPAGNHWWIATHIEDVSPDELKKRAEEWIKQSPRR